MKRRPSSGESYFASLSDTARPFFNITGNWVSVKRKDSAVTPQTLIVGQRSKLISPAWINSYKT